MRPYLAQVAAPRVLHHAAQQRQVPRRDTGEGRHPLRCALAADAFDLLVEIGQQCRLAARRAEPAAPKRSSLDQQRRQVAYDDSAALRTGAPERQGLPLEYPCRGILPHVEGRHVAQPPRVAAPQRDVGDGQVFAPLGGRARRTGEPPHPAGRRDIGLARHHPHQQLLVDGLLIRAHSRSNRSSSLRCVSAGRRRNRSTERLRNEKKVRKIVLLNDTGKSVTTAPRRSLHPFRSHTERAGRR